MKNKRTFGYIEVIFDVAYLCIALGLGVFLFGRAESVPQKWYGIMAFVLVFGDAFHLLPRIKNALQRENGQMEQLLGIGKMLTSVGMTVFYLILWTVGVMLYSPKHTIWWTIAAAALAIARIVITLLPQNCWGGKEEGKWNIYRNLPFFLLGAMTGYLYWYYRAGIYTNFHWMWLAILISFLCYIPVVLWVKKYPMIGMLMLPKSCAYVWIIAMGTGYF